MTNATQRRELARKLESFASGFDLTKEIAALLRSDATALEAVGVEPIGYVCPGMVEGLHAGRYDSATLVRKEDACFSDELGRPDVPVYPASVATRLAEALAEVERLRAHITRWRRAGIDDAALDPQPKEAQR